MWWIGPVPPWEGNPGVKKGQEESCGVWPWKKRVLAFLMSRLFKVLRCLGETGCAQGTSGFHMQLRWGGLRIVKMPNLAPTSPSGAVKHKIVPYVINALDASDVSKV